MQQFSLYGHAILSVVLFGLLVQVLNALTGIRKGARKLNPGEQYVADYDDPAYRLDRAYMNGSEVLVFFAAVTFGAILAGANPFWVNLSASAVFALRLIYTFAYYKKIGAGYGGLRTAISVLSSIAVIIMAILTVFAVFG